MAGSVPANPQHKTTAGYGRPLPRHLMPGCHGPSHHLSPNLSPVLGPSDHHFLHPWCWFKTMVGHDRLRQEWFRSRRTWRVPEYRIPPPYQGLHPGAGPRLRQATTGYDRLRQATAEPYQGSSDQQCFRKATAGYDRLRQALHLHLTEATRVPGVPRTKSPPPPAVDMHPSPPYLQRLHHRPPPPPTCSPPPPPPSPPRFDVYTQASTGLALIKLLPPPGTSSVSTLVQPSFFHLPSLRFQSTFPHRSLSYSPTMPGTPRPPSSLTGSTRPSWARMWSPSTGRRPSTSLTPTP